MAVPPAGTNRPAGGHALCGRFIAFCIHQRAADPAALSDPVYNFDTKPPQSQPPALSLSFRSLPLIFANNDYTPSRPFRQKTERETPPVMPPAGISPSYNAKLPAGSPALLHPYLFHLTSPPLRAAKAAMLRYSGFSVCQAPLEFLLSAVQVHALSASRTLSGSSSTSYSRK